MPSQSFLLNPSGSEKVTLTWKGYYKDIHVVYNGKTIANFDSKKALKDFTVLSLNPSTQISLRIKHHPELYLNGTQIDTTAHTEMKRVRDGYIALYLYGVLNIFIGSILIGIARLEDVITLGHISIILGVCFIVFGVVTQRGHRIGTILAIALLVGHIASLIIIPTDGETRIGGGGYGGLLISSFLLFLQLRALPYISKFQNKTS